MSGSYAKVSLRRKSFGTRGKLGLGVQCSQRPHFEVRWLALEVKANMNCVQAIFVTIFLVAILAGDVYGLAIDHPLAKRSTKQQGTLTDERGREIENQAHANHRAVINELNERFAGYKDNCFPMPKGCRCVVGEQTIRHQDDRQCKNPISTTARPFGRGTVRTTTKIPAWRVTTTKIPPWRATTTRRPTTTTTYRRGG